MGIPVFQMAKVGAYVVRQRLIGRKRYPLVLMLEPLFRCNLACAGCGKIDYPDKILNQRLSVAECLEAIEECGAPVVVIAGGEPLLHQELPRDRRAAAPARQIRDRLHQCAAAREENRSVQARIRAFNWSIHLDGDQRCTTVRSARRAYTSARSRRSPAKAAGFRVNINCTLFNNAEPERVAAFFDE